MDLSKLSTGAKLGIAAGSLLLIFGIYMLVKPKAPAKGDTSGKGGKGDGTKGDASGKGGSNAAQDITAIGGAAAAIGGAVAGSGSTSTTTTSVSTTSLPAVGTGVVQVDLSGTWQSQQNSAYTPQCDSGLISLGSNNALDAAYETTGAGTITFMNNPTLIANSPSGAITGTIGGSGTNSDGSTNIGTTIQWNDVNGDMWTRIS